ncbi:MAG: hypothetical protein ACIAS6_04035 [Phycisphaerales bacterium JB060]
MRMVTSLVVGVAGVAMTTTAHAQLVSGFEMPNFTGSPGGTSFVGVEGWYQPVATGIEQSVYTYAGNGLGLAQNPVGGNQFIGGRSQGGSLFPRAQKNFGFGGGEHTIAYDMAGTFNGTGDSALNLSSVSLTSEFGAAGSFKSFIALNNFVDLTNPAAGIKAEFNVFDAAGTALNNQSPGAAWENLDTNHWYRQFIDFDFSTNQITSVTILDLTTGQSTTANPDGWYMTGGAMSTLDLPDGFRFFIGGADGNSMGWDNVYLIPAPASLLAFAGLAGIAGVRRRR